MTKIKVCGVTREDDALVCAGAGADFLGFIFVPSTPRYLEPEQAAAIAAKVRENGKVKQQVIANLGRRDTLETVLPQLIRFRKGEE